MGWILEHVRDLDGPPKLERTARRRTIVGPLREGTPDCFRCGRVTVVDSDQMLHLSVVERYANVLGVDETECAPRNNVEHRLGFARGAADDPQDFGGRRLASVSFVKLPPQFLTD
jgi:hypothetical protein